MYGEIKHPFNRSLIILALRTIHTIVYIASGIQARQLPSSNAETIIKEIDPQYVVFDRYIMVFMNLIINFYLFVLIYKYYLRKLTIINNRDNSYILQYFYTIYCSVRKSR